MNTSHLRLARRVWVHGLFASMLLSGCSLFRPSVAEPPKEGSVRADYSSSVATIRTMALAIAAKGAGVDAYMGALAESTNASTPGFHQFFHPQVKERWEQLTGRTAPPDWDFTLERGFFEHFISLDTSPYEMDWSVDETHPDAGAEAATDSLYRDYQVFTVAEDGSATVIARGSARLEFVRTPDNRWLVTRWHDLVDPTDPDQRNLGARRLESQ